MTRAEVDSGRRRHVFLYVDARVFPRLPSYSPPHVPKLKLDVDLSDAISTENVEVVPELTDISARVRNSPQRTAVNVDLYRRTLRTTPAPVLPRSIAAEGGVDSAENHSLTVR